MRPYIFCEPFAGSAALTYGLFGCKPPISYMGSKAGYSAAIYDALGISRLHPPAGIVLGEVGPMAAIHACLMGATGVDAQEVARMTLAYRWSFSEKGPEHGYGGPGCKGGSWGMEARDAAIGIPKTTALIESLPSPAAQQVANIIRSWKDEEPRALWTRLKAEGWPSLMPVEGGRWLGPQKVEEVAGFVHANMLSMVKDGRANGYSRVNGEGNDYTDRHGAQGHWHATTPEVTGGRIESLPSPAAQQVAAIIRSWKDEEPRKLWERLKAEGWPSLMPVPGGRWLGPQRVEEVAGMIISAVLFVRIQTLIHAELSNLVMLYSII